MNGFEEVTGLTKNVNRLELRHFFQSNPSLTSWKHHRYADEHNRE